MSVDNLGVSLSPEENSFFESGGETAIPSDSGADTAGSETNDGSAGADKGADQGDGNKGGDKRMVPLAEHMAEKHRRRDLDRAHRETQQQLAELRGKFSIIERLNLPGAKQEEPKGPPAPEDDIFGAVKHVGETVAQMQKRLDERAAADKAATEQQAFVTNYRSDAAQFEGKNPDYRPAYSFLLETRAKELVAIGYDDPQALAASGASPDEVQAAAKALHDAVVADEVAIAELAFSKKKSPAEIIYNLAKQRGYKAAAADGKGADTGKGAEKLDAIERGQQANKSLSNTGGSSGDADMTAERLISMPIDEFETWVEKNPAKAKRIMGG